MSSIFLVLAIHVAIHGGVSGRLSKCCPRGSSLQKLDEDLEYSCKRGVPTQDLDVKVADHITTLRELERQDKIIEEMPRCQQQLEAFPEWETYRKPIEESPYYMTEDGVFIIELKYYLAGSYCLDVEEMEGQDPSLVALYCEEEGASVEVCGNSGKENCYSRCCHSWQQLDAENRCNTSTKKFQIEEVDETQEEGAINSGIDLKGSNKGGTHEEGSNQGGTHDESSNQGGTHDEGSNQGGTHDESSNQGGTHDEDAGHIFQHNPLSCKTGRKEKMTNFQLLGSGKVKVEEEVFEKNQYCLDNDFVIICNKTLEEGGNEQVVDNNNNNFAAKTFGQNNARFVFILFAALNC